MKTSIVDLDNTNRQHALDALDAIMDKSINSMLDKNSPYHPVIQQIHLVNNLGVQNLLLETKELMEQGSEPISKLN